MAHQRKRADPAPRPAGDLDARVQANERLTALAGIALLVMVVVEIVTVALQPRRVLTLHIVVGLYVPIPCAESWPRVKRGCDRDRSRGVCATVASGVCGGCSV
jgi:hypothetical protein